jgi:hypothetical protein
MQRAGEVILKFVKLRAPRPEVVILKHHQEQDLVVDTETLFAIGSANGKLRDAVSPAKFENLLVR